MNDQQRLARFIERIQSINGLDHVVITSHQAFLTNEALDGIAKTTLANIDEFKNGLSGSQLSHCVTPSQ